MKIGIKESEFWLSRKQRPCENSIGLVGGGRLAHTVFLKLVLFTSQTSFCTNIKLIRA